MENAHDLSSTPSASSSDIAKELAKIEDIKQQWLATLDAIKDPIAIIDEDYKIIKSNEAMARLTAHGDVRQIVGDKCHKIFAGLDVPCLGCTAMEALKDGSTKDFTYEHPADQKIFEISSYPIRRDEAGEARGVVQVYRDRTFHRKIEDRIRQHDKLTSLGFLAGGIAHEINNPLSGILLFSQMLLKELRPTDSHHADIVEIEAAAQRCKEIVQQILDFSRQSSRSSDINLVTLNLSELISAALRLAQVLKVAKETQVTFEWEDEDIEVLGCRSRLVQVFLNLIKNAFQAMPTGGNLHILQSNKQQDGQTMVVVEIRDTGAGIATAHLPKIFDPFFTTKGPGEGTGLGLAICYGILKELGGELSAISQIGVGTSFYVTLKAAAQQPPREHNLKVMPQQSEPTPLRAAQPPVESTEEPPSGE